MITEAFKKNFNTLLGNRYSYTEEIKQLLEAVEKFNRNNKPYSDQSIKQVFCGQRQNDDIEMAFYQLYENALERKKKLKQMRLKLEKETLN